nr:hypothetical protein [Fodinicola feengrottensis]
MLGTDQTIAAATAERAGSVASMSETASELGISLGIAVLGSVSNAVYRGQALPGGARESLAAAVAANVPADVLDTARAAFTSGFHAAGWIGAVVVAILAVAVAVSFRPTNSAA